MANIAEVNRGFMELLDSLNSMPRGARSERVVAATLAVQESWSKFSERQFECAELMLEAIDNSLEGFGAAISQYVHQQDGSKQYGNAIDAMNICIDIAGLMVGQEVQSIS